MSDVLSVGVLSLHSSKESKAILNAVDDLGYDTEWLRTENTAVDITDGSVTLEPDVDIVVNRLLLSKEEQPAEALGLATMLERARPMLNTPTATMTAMHKFATGTALAEADIPVPDAYMALSSDLLNERRGQFGPEVVYKTAIGTHGGGTWKLDTESTVNPMVGSRQAFLQELIEHDEHRHHDLRVYVVGERIVGAMNRYAPDGEWRTNVALGGSVEDATDELPDEAVSMAKRAADEVGLDYAGVDIVQGEDGYYVLEVNPTAGFRGLYKATGRSPAPHIARLAIERAGGDVDAERVAELSATLDDSRPACMPPKRQPEPVDPPVIGYTEEVVVMGTSGQETVTAKSDTGATRTSIDARLAADIGTGPIKDIVKIKSGSLKSGKSRPVVDVVVGIGGKQHTVSASVEDRSHMDYPLLLGRDILEHYHVDVRKRIDDGERSAPDGTTLEEE
ncbi:RimK family protein [Natronomonas pharaonis DSM 2160]|uniref:RimK family protein n=1 Tax=Natronomonas pharaonis (strain ATCC 35678 / DSM 2160 / CIP 103997 / JCM 8858 / NBRC 14720 / NCIMB 2260 / Gabara) TaxID=348780 RepID=A0A1U7EYD5_NATPD|nr:RimK family alpha-L-glutamate ligase [Natronomonas pharaonis]CAI50228.2 RimK family protein [Natronomonas pharaonis DSM 2160]